MSAIKAAIVGLGRWGQNLVTAMANTPDPALRFVQGVTRTPANAVDFAAHHGMVLSDDFDAMLLDPRIEAVVLATPHSKHCAQICQAAQAGKHVFVEKPLALTVCEAKQAIEECNAHGVVVSVGFNRRFLPAYKDLCEAFETGTLGKPLHIDAKFLGPFGDDYTAAMWRGTATENPAGELAMFAACLRGQGQFPVTQQEALLGVAAMEAISLSATRHGERITIDPL